MEWNSKNRMLIAHKQTTGRVVDDIAGTDQIMTQDELRRLGRKLPTSAGWMLDGDYIWIYDKQSPYQRVLVK